MWKTVMGILNHLCQAMIQFDNTFHGFRTGRGMGTASLKANLIQKLTDMGEEVLYEIFLYLHKAYVALECCLCLDILAAYGVGPCALRLLRRYWEHLSMVARTGGYFGFLFKGHRG